MNKENYLLNKLHLKPGFNEKYASFIERSSEAILFGSYAMECETQKSDIDILFVCNETNFKDKNLDFMCIPEQRLHLKSWLGSELANHIAEYGTWLKGQGNWRHSVFVSKSSIDRKKIKILTRLSHLWVKQINSDRNLLLTLFQDIVLDGYRLILLENKCAVPASAIIKKWFLNYNENIFIKLSEGRYLGSLWQEYISNLFPNVELVDLELEVKSNLIN
jgi:predicted nucleotidyltransferase